MEPERRIEIIVAENAWPGRAAAEAQAKAEKQLAEGWRLHSVGMHTYVVPAWEGHPPDVVHVCTITMTRD